MPNPLIDDLAAWKDYGFDYRLDGHDYSLTVRATSVEDATTRLKQAAAECRCYTPHGIEAIIPVPVGLPKWSIKPLGGLLTWLFRKEPEKATTQVKEKGE